MPTSQRPGGEQALSNAERQARYRARHLAPPAPAVTARHPKTDRRSRPQRWHDAVTVLLTLQAEYTNWLAGVRDSLRESSTADALQAIVDIDLSTLADIEPPKGFGRD